MQKYISQKHDSQKHTSLSYESSFAYFPLSWMCLCCGCSSLLSAYACVLLQCCHGAWALFLDHPARVANLPNPCVVYESCRNCQNMIEFVKLRPGLNFGTL